MANTDKYGKWETFDYKRNEYNFRGRRNVRLVRNGKKNIAVVKTKHDNKRQTAEEFRNEVQLLASMDHPNILKILDYDLEAERPYMVTELCRGGTLETADLAEWTTGEKALCFQQICDAFAYLWEQGLTKSDHSFDNIFLKGDKTAVLGDFESARAISKDVEGVKAILHNMGYCFWEIMEGRRFERLLWEERRLNGKIEEAEKKLEALQQQKANLYHFPGS